MGGAAGLAAGQRHALERLSGLRGFYLAGGSALAHRLQHRSSLDLDLFSLQPDADLEAAETAVR